MNLEDGIFYAIDVVKGNIVVCNKVRLACQRFLNQLEDKHWEYEFVAEYVDHVLQFFGADDFAGRRKHGFAGLEGFGGMRDLRIFGDQLGDVRPQLL